MDGSFHVYKHCVELLIFYLSVQLMVPLSAETYGGSCPEGQPVVPLNLTDGEVSGIFDDLTAQEIMKVVGYMKELPCFNIKDFYTVTINSTYIALIELMPPNKSDALLFLTGKGAKPLRYAKVVLYRGDAAEPVIEEYKVGPLPKPTEHFSIIRSKWRNPIPYSLRPPTAEGDTVPLNEFICRELAKVESVLIEATGYSYSSDCKDRCLTYMIVLPGHLTKSVRSMWITLYRRAKGFPLHPIGFQFRVNLNTTNSCNWNVDFVWFRDKEFNNMEQLSKSVLEPDSSSVLTNSSSLVDVSTTEDPVLGSFTERAEELPPPQRGPRSYMPDGRRFSVTGRKVDWFGWSFYFNIRSTTGIQLHDIRFNNQRIVYELSLQEILTLYSGASPATYFSVSMESVYFLGTLAHKLHPGVDCPEDASYFDFVHYVYFRPTLYRSAVCLFERNQGVLLKRQRGNESANSSAEELSVHTLVLRTAIVTNWYDYILDFVFHPNAVLEVVFSISGSMQPAFYTQLGLDEFGFKLFPESTANIHNHLINFKVDLDINGHVNRFETLDSEKDNSRIRLGENGSSTENFNMHHFTSNVRRTEASAIQTHTSAASNYHLFYHINSSNIFGKPRAYRLLPLTISKFMPPGNTLIAKSMAWTSYQVAVTKHKDDEDTSSTVYNAMDMLNPVLEFQKYIDDDESIVDEDLVAWVTLGSMHIPHTEDVPIVEIPGSQLSFILQPFNYFDPGPLPKPKNNQVSQMKQDYNCLPVLVKTSTGSRLRQMSIFCYLCWLFFIVAVANIWMSVLTQQKLK